MPPASRPGGKLRPTLVLGLDGATFDVISPLVREGRLPNLARWIEAGVAGPLASTVPPMTFPAWSSFLTGVGPGRHGLFDFTQKVPGRYRIRFSNATDRWGASLFRRVSRAGGCVLALGMPATFPPEPVEGLLVCGFDAPVSVGSDQRSASDPALYRAIAARTGPWMRPELDEAGGAPAWHERALQVLHGRIDRKTAFALEALNSLRRAGRPPQLATVVFSESDTVAHHFWRDHDPDSPRRDPTASAQRRDAVASVYEHLDAACAELRRAFGEEALCVVVSDHGAGGAARRLVHLNRRLQDCGLLTRRRGGRSRDAAARRVRDALLRLLPPAMAQAVFRRMRPAAARIESAARFGGFDWRRTAAFSEEANTQPGVWINRADREESGSVTAADYEKIRDEVIAALTDWRLPDGAPVVARARRREEVYEGRFVERAPDVVVELGQESGYGLSLVPTPWSEERAALHWLGDDELAGGRGRGMNGIHRPLGVWIASGGEGARGQLGPGASLVDAAPSLLEALGIPLEGEPGELDGSALAPLPRGYSQEEERLVAERLRRLGYLE